MIRYEFCPLSGSKDIRPLFKVKDYTTSGEDFEVWNNEQLGYRFTNPVPSPNEIGAYYQSEAYISHTETKRGLINKLYHFARLYTMQFKKRIAGETSGVKRGKLLDYGCGTGAYLRVMKKAGWEVSGFEPDENARSEAERQTGIKIYDNTSVQQIEKSSLDCITMWHVLEHIYDPHECLKHLKSLMKPGGAILIAVPNYRSKDAVYYREFWAGYDVPRHLHHFSYDSIKYLAEENGLSVDAMHRMHLDGFYVSMLSEQYKGPSGSMLRGVCVGFWSWLHGLLNKKRGSSILYVLRAADR